ncbi:MAG: flagellar brake protein [Lachnospiraceae bacterium]|nr:flagellar brake protein [Lachnospiraceae bacterium]
MKEKDTGLLLSKYIAPGSKIELEAIDRVLQEDGSYQRKKFDSKVVDVIDEDRLEILMPMEQTKLVLLPVNGEYDIHFFTTKGLFQCLVRVVNRYKNGNLYLLEIELISNLQKYQRREYYRYSCMLPLSFRLLTEAEKKAVDNKRKILFDELPMIESQIVDISGGGMRFVTNEVCEVNDYIFTDYALANGKRFNHVAKILAVKPLEHSAKDPRFELRCQFVDILNGEREMIIRYIFEEERKKRKRET